MRTDSDPAITGHHGAIALILAGRFVIRPVVIPLGVRFGMRPLVVAGTVLSALQYPFLAEVHGVGATLFILCALSSLGDTIYWSLLWDTGPEEWLPFLAPVTVLVFLQAGLYAPRERRAGSGRILAALVLVALIVLAFGLGTDYDFTTTGLIPTTVAGVEVR